MSHKSYQQITESERHAIALGLQQKQSIRAISRALGHGPSTISREIGCVFRTNVTGDFGIVTEDSGPS